jgi:hypothetical protein
MTNKVKHLQDRSGGIVMRDDDRDLLPLWGRLQLIDRIQQEFLLDKRA